MQAAVDGTEFEFRPGHDLGTIGARTSELEMKALAADGSMNVSIGGLDHSFNIDRETFELSVLVDLGTFYA